MPHFQTWQQTKTCTPGIALIDKPKKLLLYAEHYVANFLSAWTPDYMSNIRILAQVVLKIWCGQGFSIANGRVENGHKFAILGPTDKNSAFAYFFILMLHIQFKVPSSSGSLLSVPRRGVTDRRTGPNQYAPLNFFEVGGIKT